MLNLNIKCAVFFSILFFTVACFSGCLFCVINGCNTIGITENANKEKFFSFVDILNINSQFGAETIIIFTLTALLALLTYYMYRKMLNNQHVSIVYVLIFLFLIFLHILHFKMKDPDYSPFFFFHIGE